MSVNIAIHALERHICEALGLDSEQTASVAMVFRAGELPVVLIEMYATAENMERVVEALAPFTLTPLVTPPAEGGQEEGQDGGDIVAVHEGQGEGQDGSSVEPVQD